MIQKYIWIAPHILCVLATVVILLWRNGLTPVLETMLGSALIWALGLMIHLTLKRIDVNNP